MENTYSNKLAALRKQAEDFVEECLDLICEICDRQPDGMLRMGSHGVIAKENGQGKRVPYTVELWKARHKMTEMYSEDGWIEEEDIARWADLCVDAENCMKAGFPGYTQRWNL